MKNRSKPKVSIIIRTFNSQDCIKRALSSVLRQDIGIKEIELIVVDDGSEDKTIKTLQLYGSKIKLISPGKVGPIAALNLGIKNSDCEYYFILDSDDEIRKDAIRVMLGRITTTNSDFVYCDYLESSANGEDIKEVSTKENIFNCLAGGIIFRKSIINRIGGYDESLFFPEYDILIKLLKSGAKYNHIQLPFYIYNRHDNSLTANNDYVKRGMEQLKLKHGNIPEIRDY